MSDPTAPQLDPTTITVSQLDTLVAEIFRQRAVIEGMQAAVSVENKKLAELESTGAKYLKALGRKDHVAPAGRIGLTAKWRWNLPESEEEWGRFKAYLKERDLHDKMLSINSNTYVAYLNSLKKEAEDAGEFHWLPPGVPEGKKYEGLSVTKPRS